MSQECGEVFPQLVGGILHRRAQPVTCATHRKVGADHAEIRSECARQDIEIARVPTITVNTDNHPRIVQASPIAVMQPVQAVGTQATQGSVIRNRRAVGRLRRQQSPARAPRLGSQWCGAGSERFHLRRRARAATRLASAFAPFASFARTLNNNSRSTSARIRSASRT